MGDLTLAQYETRVLLMLNNMPSDHPAVTAGLHTEAINNAPNRLVRRMPEFFPEHQNRSWTLGPTVVGENKIALPDNLLTIQNVRVPSEDNTTDPAGWEDTREQTIGMCDASTIGLMNKDTTDVDYPRLWARKGNNLMYHPTTRTGYTTYLRIYGISGESHLSGAGETFTTHRDWDTIITFLAAEEVARGLGWTERADELEAAAEKQIQRLTNVPAADLVPRAVESELAFTRSRVYGGTQ